MSCATLKTTLLHWLPEIMEADSRRWQACVRPCRTAGNSPRSWGTGRRTAQTSCDRPAQYYSQRLNTRGNTHSHLLAANGDVEEDNWVCDLCHPAAASIKSCMPAINMSAASRFAIGAFAARYVRRRHWWNFGARRELFHPRPAATAPPLRHAGDADDLGGERADLDGWVGRVWGQDGLYGAQHFGHNCAAVHLRCVTRAVACALVPSSPPPPAAGTPSHPPGPAP